MFDHPGKKIKTAAKVLFWVGAIGSAIVSNSLMSILNNSLGGLSALLAIIIFIVMLLLLYVITLLIVAQGELVENSTIIREKICGSDYSEEFYDSNDEQYEENIQPEDDTVKQDPSPVIEEDSLSDDVCDSCSKTTKVHQCKITDNDGIVYYHVLCDDCIKKTRSMKGIK